MITRRRALMAGAAVTAAGTGAYLIGGKRSYDSAARAVWSQRRPAADDDLAYLAHYATLAANNHNAQPWRFSRSGHVVQIAPDASRATPAVDPDNHHLFASLGSAAENLILAALAEGKAAAAAFAADGDGHVEVDVGGTGTRDPLFDAILERQCTRGTYDGSQISAGDLDSLASAARIEGCEVIFISDGQRMNQALEFIVSANTAQVTDAAFRAELKSWLRFSAQRAVASGDGLYAGCSGNPVVPQWLGSAVFDLAFTAGGENDRYARQLKSSSGIAVFVTEKDDKPHWVAAGRSFQRFALKATSMGIRHAFINQPVEVASVRPRFADWLGVGNRRPDLVVRYGRGPAMPRSLRRPVSDVMASA